MKRKGLDKKFLNVLSQVYFKFLKIIENPKSIYLSYLPYT